MVAISIFPFQCSSILNHYTWMSRKYTPPRRIVTEVILPALVSADNDLRQPVPKPSCRGPETVEIVDACVPERRIIALADDELTHFLMVMPLPLGLLISRPLIVRSAFYDERL
jgi:hypothetical protein